MTVDLTKTMKKKETTEKFKLWPNTLKGLPTNYNFEIAKTCKLLDKMVTSNITNKSNINNNNHTLEVTMQFPDGLLCYAPVLINYFCSNFNIDVTVLNDVVYGACCVDDTFVCDLLIHYGHSCLIPVTEMKIRVLYIFVDIIIDIEHVEKIIRKIYLKANQLNDQLNKEKISMIGTIQFNNTVNMLNNKMKDILYVPQCKPLSRGEVLGCTSPLISTKTCIYIGDGRFHLESAMIKNKNVEFYKYCPFKKEVTREYYDYDKMVSIRCKEIEKVKHNLINHNHKNNSYNVGIVLSGLGKQANTKLLERVKNKLKRLNSNVSVYKIMTTEINEDTLDKYQYVDAFVQIGCPRLSIDWGNSYKKPLLNAYEILSADIQSQYEMDYYDIEKKSEWGMYY